MTEPDEPTAQPSTPGDALAAMAREVGLPPSDADAWGRWLTTEPAGDFHSPERELGRLDLSTRIQAEPDVELGLSRLPLSARAALEHKGLIGHPLVLANAERLGLRLRELDKAIEAERQRDPHGDRLRQLYVKRFGNDAKGATYF